MSCGFPRARVWEGLYDQRCKQCAKQSQPQSKPNVAKPETSR